MPTDLKEILDIWEREKPSYVKALEIIHSGLSKIKKDSGVFSQVTVRPKDETSLAKKLIKKGVSQSSYDAIADKAGARVICRYREDIPAFAQKIRETFKVTKEEDKSKELKFDQFGYKSIHFDVGIDIIEGKDTKCCSVEIQLRTMCDHAWAEISHDLSYKAAEILPDELRRQIYSLGGLFEVADTSISSIGNSIRNGEVNIMAVLELLEKDFNKIFEGKFDHELSKYLLEKLYDEKNTDYLKFKEELDSFFITNFDKIKDVIQIHKDESKYIPFITQPEIILILFLIEKKPFVICKVWNDSQISSNEDLKKLGLWWGRTLDSYFQE